MILPVFSGPSQPTLLGALIALIAIVGLVIRELLAWFRAKNSPPAVSPELEGKINEIHAAAIRNEQKIAEIHNCIKRENPHTGTLDIYVPRGLTEELSKIRGQIRELDRRLDDVTHQSGVWNQRGD